MAGSLLLFLAGSLAAQDSTFLLSTTDPTYHTPAFIGNGAFSLLSAPLGTTPALSFAAGVYDHGPGDVPRIAALPEWNAIDVFDGQHWLSERATDPTALGAYRQTLDLHAGILHTSYEWPDGARRTAIAVDEFISRADPELAVVKLVLVPSDLGAITLVVPLRPRPAPARLALAQLERTERDWTIAKLWYPGHVVVATRGATPGGVWVSGKSEGRGTEVAMAAEAVALLGAQSVALHPVTSDTGVALEATIRVSPGVPLTIYKYIALVTSRSGPTSAARAQAAAHVARGRGYEALLEAHRAAWNRLWQTDVVVEGDPELQRVIHAMLFYLLASVREGTDESIPPMGLSSAGYYGHVFWDADTWMFPALVVTYPDLARSMVGFRYRALRSAEHNARAHGYRGAMYPWESDELGEETTPKFAWQNALYENHVTGDVAAAQWQYYLATGDSAWLSQYGYPVLKETADFWVSRASFDQARQRYDIRHVVSVDEGLIGIGNDTYTNALARHTLEAAVAASHLLGRSPDPRWAKVAEALFIPYDSAAAYHPTYEGAPPEKRGSVVPLLSYPLRVPMSEQARRNDLAAAVRLLRLKGPGAMMTTTFYPIVAAELRDSALLDSLVPLTYRGHLRPPFDALAETPRNEATSFLTGAGAFLQQVIFGYTGLRLGDRGLAPAFRPLLPRPIERMVLKNFSVRGRRYDIVVERDTVRFTPR